MNSINFFVPGDPVPKGRGRATIVAGAARVFTPTKTRDYENFVKQLAALAMCRADPWDCACAVEVLVMLPIPASMSKKDQARALLKSLLPAKRPDLDNCVKACLDGMNGIVYADDRLICELTARKIYSVKPGVYVEVKRL